VKYSGLAGYQVMEKKPAHFGFLILCITVGFLTLCAILAYAAQNHSGHTGLNPYLALAVFVPLGITGLSFLLMIPCPWCHKCHWNAHGSGAYRFWRPRSLKVHGNNRKNIVL
jgi:hypothetical protein